MTSSGTPAGASSGEAPRFLRDLRALLPGRSDVTALRLAPGRDLLAGVTVALVALPLALAFGTSSGMGAASGITTAVVAGILAAVFGSSNLSVSGPTGAMAVVLVPIVAQHGPGAVLFVGLMSGVLLVVVAALHFGQFARYVPLPVVEGFTLGIAIVIALQQVPLATGYAGRGDSTNAKAWTALSDWLHRPHWLDVAVCVACVVFIVVLGRLRPAVPGAIIAVALATAAAEIWHFDVGRVGSVTSAFHGLSFPSVPLDAVPSLIVPALAVTMLGALETLMTATVADAMSGTAHPHEPDRELFGQGIANLAVPFFGGMPATAAIARTAVSVRTGARSRSAAVIHSLVVLVAVLAAAKLVADIPMASLAGVLFVTCARMVDATSLTSLARSGRGELLVLGATAVCTVAFTLVVAVMVGVVVAGAVVLYKAGRRLQLEQMPLDPTPGSEGAELAALDHHIVSFRIAGPLFFAAAHQSLLELTRLSDVRVVILRLSGITALDATGAAILKNTVEHLEKRGVVVLLSGIADVHSPLLKSLGVYDTLAHERHVFPDAHSAAEHARLHMQRIQHA